jgi:hypothetical protein
MQKQWRADTRLHSSIMHRGHVCEGLRSPSHRAASGSGPHFFSCEGGGGYCVCVGKCYGECCGEWGSPSRALLGCGAGSVWWGDVEGVARAVCMHKTRPLTHRLCSGMAGILIMSTMMMKSSVRRRQAQLESRRRLYCLRVEGFGEKMWGQLPAQSSLAGRGWPG